MKINEFTAILGKKSVLVPYEEKHVLKYHEWMKSEELQQLTASEPLTVEEEKIMQRNWREDDNKCTFIILDAELYKTKDTVNEIDAMVGDVNLFFNDPDDPSSAEIEIMIAETSARGKGLGKEALFHMMRYGMERLNVSRYTAKISLNNLPSLNMFHKIGFKEVSRSEVFQEVTLELPLDGQTKNEILSKTESFKLESYPLPS
ncbi:hypothetical protein CHS0354_001012 [Potamilus streckersoni]|uniref:N-acetyltransferase 9-like protein n=1 Tax=Potamilus streckersoni TaxID=2493646 RepID=A0AAE0RUW2_9BIVA|nr:hypothetical protein CHS0354_001012 [Potamilus streckersoni]